MIASIIIALEPNGPHDRNDRPSPRDVQGVFFNLATRATLPALEGRAEQSLAKQIHDESDLKPYTTAWGGFDNPFMRLTLINPSHYALLSPALYGLIGEDLRVGANTYRVKHVLHEDHPRARLTTHQSLLQSADATQREVTLEFLTATTFKRGKLIMPMPEPKLVFHNLIEKWNQGSAVRIDAGFATWLETNVTISRAQIKTRLTDSFNGKVLGFTGRVTFEAWDSNPVRLKQLGALARFAFFAGVGYKTTLGLGQTRFIAPEITVPEPPAPIEEGIDPAWQSHAMHGIA
jgi:CRISPR-associated endoribonuclease Cas6